MIDPVEKIDATLPQANERSQESVGPGQPISAAKENSAPDETAPEKLSAEEQMDRFEEYLRETDCGHRPC
ncbi:MAG: hypothetical protein H7Y43_00980 [Akkermansiaceae bacterium]|nr:hypothetical protein [Verrucomicrobiales bacterium]